MAFGFAVNSVPQPANGAPVGRSYQELKTALHRELLNKIDLERLTSMQDVYARSQVQNVIYDLISTANFPLSGTERERICREVLQEVFGLGPLEPLLQDQTITDILVNTHRQVYVERAGMLELTNVVFKDAAHLRHIIDKIVSRVGRRVDESSPMCDARLEDGSRVNVVIPPLAIDGPIMSIRRFGKVPIGVDQLLSFRTITPAMLEFLKAAVRSRHNIVISGGTGSGKTTLLNVLSGFISDRERIVTIEDSAELQLQQPHVVRLECRPPNVEGKGAVRQRELVINALRMRPDRIVVGEVRGGEALDMLQAMNTGHDGSLTTIHANNPRDAIARMETMSLMADVNLPDKAIRQQMASAISLIVQVARLSDGSRRVTQISEVMGVSDGMVTLQDIFVFDRMGIGPNNRVLGRFRATGIRPGCAERIKVSGIQLSPNLFEHVYEV
ncbi:MAG TPA: CpaF family protein [Candidatus Angelobacter sp.]|jgi:pilus assembly protein CpaF|nr:CpaF family protein [Candidatus Angelobacter sp.]